MSAEMLEREILASQLLAARHALDGALLLLGVSRAPAPVTEGCAHPEGKRRNAETMGHPDQFFCEACQTLVQPGVQPSAKPAEGGSA